jgi:hypothetical protein
MAECKSCGAAITWVLTEKDKPMPVDAEPVEQGNVELYRDDAGEQRARVVVEGDATLPGFDLPARYQSHFASCPQADQHRKAA